MDRFLEANSVLTIFSKRFLDLKKGLPVRPSEMGILNILIQTPGPHTSVMLAELMGVSKPMITALLTSLGEKGYVVKEQSTYDKRTYHIIPTDKAISLVEHARKNMDGHLNRLVETMGPSDFDALIRLAKKAGEVLRTEQEE